MDKEHESTARNSLVPSSGHALARRSDALVTRGIRDLEKVEQRNAARILVVDDEEEMRDIISSMLTSAGYQCLTVAGGLEALALLESGEEFDLLLTDMLNFPLDGLSLLERTKEKFPDIPVVVASAVHDDGVVEACIRGGAYEYLFLPFEREQLLAAVSRALEHRRTKIGSHR